MYRLLFLIITILLLPLPAFANVIWPGLIAETKITSIPIIAASLVIECIVARYTFIVSWKTAVHYAFWSNVVSGLLGVFCRPLTGLLWEATVGLVMYSTLGIGTFNPATWCATVLLGSAFNGVVELWYICKAGNEEFTRKRFLIFWAANFVTVAGGAIWGALTYPD